LSKRTVSGIVLTLVLVGVLALAFRIQPVKAGGTVYIRADGSVDPPTANIASSDNVTYTLTGDIDGPVVVERDSIVIDGAGCTIQGAGIGAGIDLSERTNVIVRNTQIREFSYGVNLYSSSNNSVSGNSIAYNFVGVWLNSSSCNNSVSGNSIANNFVGVGLGSSSDNSVSGNSIRASDYEGVHLYSSSDNSVSGNSIVADNQFGILLDSSSNNSFSGNIIANNFDGVWLSHSSNNSLGGNIIANNHEGIDLDSSSSNSVSGNIIANNERGVYLAYSSDNNSVYHNNFNNYIQQVFSRFSTNVWDDGYPSGGNYWSDYAGVDVKSGPSQDQPGSDGIGDTPYVVDANNRDGYPLMKPYAWAPHELGITSLVASKTVVGQGFTLNINVTISNYGSSSENFNVTVYANATIIGAVTNVTLANGNYTIITFTWNTTGFAKGNHTINAYATPVLGETITVDNSFTYGVMKVTVPGDVNGDFRVNMSDVGLLLNAFGSKPGKPNWAPNCDVDSDNKTTMSDIMISLDNFGKHYP
jgi:parallel beta-helix repeat protein